MKKKLFLLLLLVLTLVLVASCGQSESTPETSQEAETGKESTESTEEKEKVEESPEEEKTLDTFIYALGGDPGNFVNPVTSDGRWDLTVMRQVYSPLFMVYPDRIDWFLATEVIPSDDGLVYTVKLREDVLWSDGQPFTADDVVYSYEVLTNPETGSTSAARLTFDGEVAKAEKVDDYTVDIILPKFNPAAMDLISIFVLPKHIYEGTTDFANSPLNATPVGTGPYTIKEYRMGEYVHLEAVPSYFDGEAAIKNVILRIIDNPNSAKIALQSGEVDAITALPADLADFEGNDNFEIHSYSESRVGYIGMNMNSEALQDVRTRQAIFYALDKQEMNLATYKGEDFFNNAYSFLPPNNAFANKDVNMYGKDIEKAKELLAESGAESATISLGYNSSDAAGSVQAILIQESLKEIGLNVELKGMDGTALISEFRNPDSQVFDMFLNGYIMGNDPSRYAALFLSNGGSNFFHYSNEKLDELFAKGAVEADDKERVAIYNEAQEIVLDDAIQYPIVDNLRILVARKDLSGLDDAKLVAIYTFGDMSKLFYQK